MLLKNKKAFLARHWIVAFTVFVALMGLSYLMVQGLATKYDNPDIINENFQSTYNKYPALQDNIQGMYDESRSEEGLSASGTFTTLFSATFVVISLIFDSLTLPGAMLSQFALDAGVPPAIAAILFTLPLVIIILMVVLIIISSVSRGKI